MFIDGEPVVEIKICRALERKLQKAQAEAALMREALEDFKTECRDCGGVGWYAVCQDAPEQIQCQRCHGVQFALSSNAGRELLEELQRLRQLVSTIETETCENCNYQRSIHTPCKCGQFAVVGTNARLRSDLAKAQAQCAELRSEVGKAFREGYCNGYGSDTLGDHGSEDFNLSYNQSRAKKVMEGKL